MPIPLKMAHLFGGIAGGVVFGLVSGLLLGSCVFEGGPNHRAASGGPAPPPEETAAPAQGEKGPSVPGGMDPGSGVMESVFARVGELKQVLEKDPKNRSVLIEMGNLYYDANKFGDAAKYYERALAIDRNDPNVLTDAGNSYWMSGDAATALALFRETQAKFPQHWQSAASLFFLAVSQRDSTLAGQALSRVRLLNPRFEKLPDMEKLYEDMNRGGRG